MPTTPPSIQWDPQVYPDSTGFVNFLSDSTDSDHGGMDVKKAAALISKQVG
jgi:hypothetical protein